MSFDVYVERTQDPSPEARQRVAKAIAERFGVPHADLLARLEAGRFRAKAGIDRGKALQFAAELEALGAVCSVVAQDKPGAKAAAPVNPNAQTMMGSGVPAAPALPRATPGPQAAVAAPRSPLATARTMAAVPVASAPLPSAASVVKESGLRAAAPVAAAKPAPAAAKQAPATKNFGNSSPATTGLQAAFNAGTESEELSALNDSWNSSSFSLSTLDGEDDADLLDMPTPAEFLPADLTPKGGIPKSVLSAPPQQQQQQQQASNPFAPPSEDDGDDELELVVVSLPQPKSHKAPTVQRTPVSLAEVAPSLMDAPAEKKPKKPKVPGVPLDIRARMVLEKLRAFAEKALGTPRGRFATGAALAVILAFLPTHVVASAWESISFSGSHDDLKNEYLGALDQGRDAMLGMKDTALINMYSSRRFIVFGSLIFWIGATAGLFFLWQTRVDTERLRAFLASKKWTAPPRPIPATEPPVDGVN